MNERICEKDSAEDKKCAIVTGSTKGIGKSIGLRLLRENCFVVFNFSSDNRAAQDLNNEIKSAYKGQYEIIQSDLSNVAGVLALTDKCKAISEKWDYIVLNTGITNRKLIDEISYDEWAKVIDTNLNMPFWLIKNISDSIADGGSILFIGSVMGQKPHAMSLVYGVSKAGIHFLTQSLVKHFCDRKITVNAICPGFVDTPWQLKKDPEHRKRIESKIALGRFASPDEIAQFAVDVMHNSYVNGSVLNIDGGYDFR